MRELMPEGCMGQASAHSAYTASAIAQVSTPNCKRYWEMESSCVQEEENNDFDEQLAISVHRKKN